MWGAKRTSWRGRDAAVPVEEGRTGRSSYISRFPIWMRKYSPTRIIPKPKIFLMVTIQAPALGRDVRAPAKVPRRSSRKPRPKANTKRREAP